MIRVKAEIQYLIIVVIFILSVFIGIDRSGIININGTKKVDFDLTKIEKIFEEKLNYTKIDQTFQSKDLNKLYQKINQILAQSDYEEIYSFKQGHSFVGIYEVPADDKSIINSLRAIEELKSETVMKNSELNTLVNIESNLENYRYNKLEIQKQLSSTAVSTTSKRQLRADLEKVQSKIDSLVYLPTLVERSKEYDLIYVNASQDITSASINKSKVIEFVKIFFIMLIVQLLGLVLLYLFLVFVTWLLRIMGIKTKSSSLGNYNNYYSRGQKKVKRIYKDEAAKKDEKTEK